MSQALIVALIFQFAQIHHLDPLLVEAVVSVESHYNVKARGLAGEVGLMQVMPSNAKHLTPKELFTPETNIAIGVALLAEAKDNCPHQENNTWLLCYNMGLSHAKKVRHPKKWPYYKQVMSEYDRLKKEEMYGKN